MCCVPKYHHQALLTVNNFKANEQIQIERRGSFPRNAKFPSGSQEIRPDDKFSPTRQVQLNESSDSTCVSTKIRRYKRSQLSDVMRAWLGPQTPSMEGRPHAAVAQEVCPGPFATTVMPEWPFHLLVQQ